MPLRRSSAEAFQLLAAHAFGEAGSPYVTGAISDSFDSSLENEMSKCKFKSQIICVFATISHAV